MSDAERVHVSQVVRKRSGLVDIIDKTVGWITDG